jgi:glycosyltransferase involved in cell wall biosynthesis
MFSVVIPSYNREKVVVRAINSILNQTYQDFEIIVVDDGSKDNTEGVVRAINDNRIKYVRQDNAGACVARNTGIKNARGKYVSFLDSDDEWFPQMLEKQLEQYQADEEVGCVYSDLQVKTGNGDVHSFGKPFVVKGNCYAEILRQGYMAPTSVLSAKRECFGKVGLFDVSLPASQDDDMCFKLSKFYKVGLIPDIMATMNVEQINRISNNPKRVADGWWMLWNKYEDDVYNLCGEEIIRQRFQECMGRYAVIKENDLFNQAYERYAKYGGKLSCIQVIKYKLLSYGFYSYLQMFAGLIRR